MSEADRAKWDGRYRDGAFEQREQPSVYLVEQAAGLAGARRAAPEQRALDLAAGAGRNAVFLAGLGFQVDAVDISSVALARGRDRALADGFGDAVRWIEQDLDDGFAGAADYDLIVNFRYVNLPLLERLLERLRPGGTLVVEQHLSLAEGHAHDVVGPANPAFRVAPGELAELARSLTTLHVAEGLVTDPDGRTAALAQLTARRGRD